MARDGMSKRKGQLKIFYLSWGSLEVKFLVQGFEVALET